MEKKIRLLTDKVHLGQAEMENLHEEKAFMVQKMSQMTQEMHTIRQELVHVHSRVHQLEETIAHIHQVSKK